MMNLSPGRPRVGLSTALLVALFSAQATAQQCPEEPQVQHWSITPNDVASVGFIAGEEWGAVFDTPEIPADHFPIEILRVGFAWGSAPFPPPCGTGAPSIEESIKIYQGNIANPGPLQFEIGPVQLVDGCINEFDIELIPSAPGTDRIVMAPPFMCTLELANSPNIFTGPGPVRDQAGCIPGKNVIVCTGGICNGFTDACSVGCILCPSGNWKVHVVYRQVDCGPIDPFTEFCPGDGGNQMGCTDCPCGNNAMPGSPGGCLNSAGRSCEILMSGNPSVTADTLRVEASGANSSTFGVLFSAINQLPNFGACPPGSGVAGTSLDGLRCVGGSAVRNGARPSDANGDIGVTTNGWGPPNGPPGGLIANGMYVAGQTRHYQIFYREMETLGCLTAQNTSNAVSVTFTP